MHFFDDSLCLICLLLLCVLPIISLQILAMVQCAQVCEEIVIEDAGELHQRVGVNPAARKDEIDIVAVAIQLLGQPCCTDSLSGHFRLDDFADVIFAVVHLLVVSSNRSIKKAWNLFLA